MTLDSPGPEGYGDFDDVLASQDDRVFTTCPACGCTVKTASPRAWIQYVCGTRVNSIGGGLMRVCNEDMDDA
jgi:hypothetical protein